MLQEVIWRERKLHKRRIFIRFNRGKLYMLPLRRSRSLIALGPTLIDAMLSQEMPEQFATAVTIHSLPEFKKAEDASGAKKSKLGKGHLYLEYPTSRRLYGFVHKIVHSPDAKTLTLLRKEGLAYLRAAARPKRTLTLTHPGMPFLRRGDALRVAIGGRALRRQVVWASHIVHQVSPEGYTVEIEVTFDDPYIDRRGQSILQKLRATHDDAVGNRARLDPLWYLPKGNKGDAVVPGSSFMFPEVQRGYKGRLRGEKSAGVGLVRLRHNRGAVPVVLVGRTTAGGTPLPLPPDEKRVVRFEVGPARAGRTLPKLSVLLDGLNQPAGAQPLRAVAYDTGGALLGSSGEAVIPAGAQARAVDLPFPGGLAIPAAATQLDLGVHAGVPTVTTGAVVRVFGDPNAIGHPVTAKKNADTYADGAAATFGAPTTELADMTLFGQTLEAWAPAELEVEMYYARLPFPESQRVFSETARSGESRLAVCSWHGTRFDAERGAYVVAQYGGKFDDWVGERVRITLRGRTVGERDVYGLIHNASELDVRDDLSVTRRLFTALAVPALDRVDVTVERMK